VDTHLDGIPVPAAATPLVGRAAEMDTAAALLFREARLVTLIGTGGAGKTRLALELAGSDPTAVFVDLAPLSDPGQVLPAVARAVGVSDAGSQPVPETLSRYLADRSILVVLDNVEHVLDAAGGIAALLARCRGLRVLATSRAPLQVPGEHLVEVGPLPVPDPRNLSGPAELAGVPSVTLFLGRVRDADPAFSFSAENARSVAEICVALNGLPLALEIAAAQVRTHGLDEVLTRMRSRFQLLSSTRRAVPDRHRSLANAVGWSVALLDEPAKVLLGRVSVFAGGWVLDAAQQVCTDPGQDVLGALATLVDQSLVIAQHTGAGVRYRMLETIREYATGLLSDRGEQAVLLHRHLQWCGALAAAVAAAFGGPDEVMWLDLAESEHDNLQAALRTCTSVDDGLKLAAALTWFWDVRGHLSAGRAHLERILALPGGDPPSRAAALDGLGQLAMFQNDHTAAQESLRASAALSRSLGDHVRVAWSTATWAISTAMVGDLAAAAALAGDAVEMSREHAAQGGVVAARSLCGLAMVRWAQHRHVEAWALFDECLDGPAGASAWGRGRTRYFMGWFAYQEDDDRQATAFAREAALLLDGIGDRRSVIDCLDVLGCVAARAGDSQAALGLFTVSQQIRSSTGVIRHSYLDQHVAPAQAAARTALGPAAAQLVAGAAQQMSVEQMLTAPPARSVITPRETEVAGLVADGLTNRQIGRRLGISERTAERHVENLRAKLGVGSRTQVAAWAAGGLPPPHS